MFSKTEIIKFPQRRLGLVYFYMEQRNRQEESTRGHYTVTFECSNLRLKFPYAAAKDPTRRHCIATFGCSKLESNTNRFNLNLLLFLIFEASFR